MQRQNLVIDTSGTSVQPSLSQDRAATGIGIERCSACRNGMNLLEESDSSRCFFQLVRESNPFSQHRLLQGRGIVGLGCSEV